MHKTKDGQTTDIRLSLDTKSVNEMDCALIYYTYVHVLSPYVVHLCITLHEFVCTV